ncbi:DUF1186 domain-containing protein [Bacteroidales bacterium OttesenSCG-928-I21]|nr:DUF1186 domain-containing protein [Bacteroidales bacterium OttesenSCG-928-I21]
MTEQSYHINYDNSNIDRPTEFLQTAGKIHNEVINKNKPNIKKVEHFFNKWKQYPDVWTWYYNALKKNKRKDEAEKCLNKIIELFPDYLYGKLSRVLTFIEEENFEKAREILGETPDISFIMPGKTDIFYEDILKYYLAYAQLELACNNEDAATKIYQKAIDVAGEDNHIVKTIQKEIFSYRMKNMADRFAKSQELIRCSEFIDTNDYESYKPQPFIHKEIQDLYENIFSPEKEEIDKILSLPRESLIQDFENIIRKTIYERLHESDEELNYNLLAHSIYFLTELKATESYSIILQMLRQSSKYFEFWFSDVFEPICIQLIYYIALEHPDKLKAYLKEPNLYTFFKAIVFDAMVCVVDFHPEKRNEVLDWFREILDFYYQERDNENITDTMLNGSIEYSVLELGFKELLPVLEKFHEEMLIDEMTCGDIEAVREEFELNRRSQISEIKNIYEFFEQEAKWEENISKKRNEEEQSELLKDFKHHDEFQTIVRTEPKIGRNDPCSCGSGKKYKKCCGS